MLIGDKSIECSRRRSRWLQHRGCRKFYPPLEPRELANQGHDSHAISRSGQHRGSCFYRSVLRRFPRCSRSHFSSDDFSRFFLSLSLFLKLFFSALTENVTRDPPRDRRSTALLSSRRRDRGCTRPRRGKNHVKIGDNTRRIDGSV